MSDDSYHPEIEKDQSDHSVQEDLQPYLSSISKGINKDLPLPEIQIDYE